MFGGSQQSGVSDLLLGAGFNGGSLGNGFGNDAGAPSSSGAGGSSSGSTAFDLNDFPSLGGTSNNNPSSANSSGNGLAAALRQQQQMLAHQQQMLQGNGKQQNNLYRLAMSGGSNGGANFTMATEDFPALPGAPPTSSSNNGNNGPAPSSSSSLLIGGTGSAVNSNQSGIGFGSAGSRAPSSSSGGMYSNDLDSGAPGAAPGPNVSQGDGIGLLGGGGLGGIGGLGGLQQSAGGQPSQLNLQGSRSGPPSALGGSGSAAGSALSGDFGLLGLLGVIRMTDADRNALALGSDLTMLGLNLGSSEQIYNTFASPFSESTGSTKEPHYQLPMCYYMQPPALKTGHLSKFQLETLFYIFYALPKDVLQAYAAQELYAREWRYHGDLKLWFKRAGPSDGITSTASAPQYLYFDINSWERRIFNGNMNQNLTNGFLMEDDIRVKFPSS